MLATSGGNLFTWLGGYGTLLGVIAKESLPPLLLGLFDFGWFFRLAVAGTFYYASAERR